MDTALFKRTAGCWDLVEANFTTPDGTKIEPWGPNPVGVSIVTEQGQFSVQAARRERTRFAGDQPTAEEKQTAYDEHMGYFGHFIDVDDDAGTITSLVEGASNANIVGGEQLRYIETEEDDKMVLRTPPIDLAGTKLVGMLSWKRRKNEAG